MRYSPLTEINRQNVSELKVAWLYHTGDISDGSHGRRRSGFETTPLVVDGTLYLTTPFNRVIALDPETGTERWAYDPKTDLSLPFGDGLINRGVATWLDPARGASQPCRRRIFEATLDARLVALDAATGRPCEDFGRAGQVSLEDAPRYIAGWYHMTSPPAVIDSLVVVGSAIDDNGRVDMPSGVVRAFDARSGALRWKWDPIPPNPDGAPGETAAKAWRSGAANAWSIMAVDLDRHLVFVPTGSASPDFYGGNRPGDDKWADSVAALRAQSGEVAWGFQLVHHDLWDYDTASPPLVATLRRDGNEVPVVIQGNKTGNLFVLDRDSGKPVFPVEERSVPQSDIPGEKTSPTQPFPIAPPPLARQSITPDQAWGLTPADREECRGVLEKFRHSGIFAPPSLEGTVVTPGFLGGMNWSGYAFDPERQLLVVNTSNLPFWVQLVPPEKFDAVRREGNSEFSPQTGAPYGMRRNPLFSHSGLPCSPPPWGTLTAVDLASGKIRWQVPTGSMRDVTTNCTLCHISAGKDAGGRAASAQDLKPSHATVPPGSPTLGGPIVTAGGLIFIAGTLDPYFRAFDVETGRELWKAKLPASGHATPMTYRLPNGKQYVVIAAGGHAKIREETQSDALVAFALP